MVEWAWFVNSYGDDGVYGQLMNGDKDSFLLAFALANKTGDYYQVRIPAVLAHDMLRKAVPSLSNCLQSLSMPPV